MFEFLEPEFMRRALLAALMVGVIAPSIGLYLVQRKLALMGDGVGHVALTGVAVGFLTDTEPLYTALAVASAGALLVELIRQFGGASADVALAMLFYGGIAGGVVLIGLTPTGSVTRLNEFLFGSILTVTDGDLAFIAILGVVVLAFTLGLRRALFAVCQDEEHARVCGLPTRLLGLGIAGHRGDRRAVDAGRRRAADQCADDRAGGDRATGDPQLRGHLRARAGARGDRLDRRRNRVLRGGPRLGSDHRALRLGCVRGRADRARSAGPDAPRATCADQPRP